MPDTLWRLVNLGGKLDDLFDSLLSSVQQSSSRATRGTQAQTLQKQEDCLVDIFGEIYDVAVDLNQ